MQFIKILIIGLSALYQWGFIQAQQIERYTIASSGGHSVSSTGQSLHSTLGEVSGKAVTISSGSLTQGYQQLDLQVNPVFEWPENDPVVIYPNPTPASLRIEASLSGTIRIELRDLLGRLLFEQTSSVPQLDLDLSTLPSQTYILSIIRDQQIKQFKVIKS